MSTACLLLRFKAALARRFRKAPARHFLLAEGDHAPGLVRFLSGRVELAEGSKTSWVTVTRTGTFSDPRYGQFDITRRMLEQMIENFDARVLGQDVFIDVAHKHSDGAAAKVLKLAIEGTKLRALVEWTDFGIDAVRKRGFAYLSAEYHDDWKDNEKGAAHGCTLVAAGLTTRPVIKNLDPVQLSESLRAGDDEARLAYHPDFIKSLESDMNKHLIALRTKLLSLGLTEEQIKPIIAAATKQLGELDEADQKCLAIADTFTAAGETLSAQLKALSATGQQPGQIVLQVGAPSGMSQSDVQAEVARILAEQATNAAKDKATLEGKVKLLSDTVTADKTLSEAEKGTLVEQLTPLITKELSDDQVKGIATMLLAQASRASAAVQLATLGFRPPSGSVHITVETNEVKSLQEQVDTRLGFKGLPDAKRYERTGGKLLEANKDFAEKALAHFDHQHGHRLVYEHKMLAAGSGNISDVSVPAIWERTVLREALYNMVGLNFVDVGTYLRDANLGPRFLKGRP